MGMFVCLSVCSLVLLENDKAELHQISEHVSCGRGSVLSDGVVHPVFWMTSYFHNMRPMAEIKHGVMFRRSAPGGGTS